MSELEGITTLCTRLGASPEQAATMARQLLKRADQWVAERKIPREEALAQLLKILVEGRQGNLPPGYAANPPGSE